MKNNMTISKLRKYAEYQGVSKKDFYRHAYGFGIGVPVVMIASGFVIMGLASLVHVDPLTDLVVNLFALYLWVFKVCKPLINLADTTDPLNPPKKMGTYKVITVEGKPVIVDGVGDVVR